MKYTVDPDSLAVGQLWRSRWEEPLIILTKLSWFSYMCLTQDGGVFRYELGDFKEMLAWAEK